VTPPAHPLSFPSLTLFLVLLWIELFSTFLTPRLTLISKANLFT
jgi:hypothetical protein